VSRGFTPIPDALESYIRDVFPREPEPLKRLREETEDHPEASCQISVEQGQFLNLLARLMGARKALEVGVFMGYSSSWVALALPPDGRLVACERDPEYAARARETWRAAGVEDRIELRQGPALDTLDALLAEGAAGSFDLAFIDADKGNYPAYYERSLALLRPGGLIAVDNVLWHGRVADAEDRSPDTEAIRRFNRALHADSRVALALATMGDGMALALKLH
jgi:caffeoyl-CoA O-methyltransferase